MRAIWMSGFMLMAGIGHAGPVTSFGDIEFWVGDGSNQAAVAIDWMGDSDADESLVWGYRWDGQATGADMLLSVVAAESLRGLLYGLDDERVISGVLGKHVAFAIPVDQSKLPAACRQRRNTHGHRGRFTTAGASGAHAATTERSPQ